MFADLSLGAGRIAAAMVCWVGFEKRQGLRRLKASTWSSLMYVCSGVESSVGRTVQMMNSWWA